ncbi:Rha family transcriptional regulator [Lacticaseibacillus sharpeae]|nr:Rha family transcriptional regulator [Lacticaseibacillus sharpeae]
MDILVFLDGATTKADTYTTTDIIAKYGQVEAHAVRQMVRRHGADLSEFGVLAFDVPKPPKGSKGGRPHKNYKLNEEQAALLITYLANTPPVRRFKKELVRQFFTQREELATRRAYRSIERKTRRMLTDSIQAWPHRNQWSYKQFTDLLCKATTGMNVKQLRQERAAGTKAPAADLYTAAEQADYQRLERGTIALMDIGQTYEQIKAAVLAMNAVATS